MHNMVLRDVKNETDRIQRTDPSANARRESGNVEETYEINKLSTNLCAEDFNKILSK